MRLYKTILFCLLIFKAYGADADLRSPPPNLPVEVKTRFYLVNMASINEKQETYHANIYLSFIWNDPRLKFTSQNNVNYQTYLEDAAVQKLSEIWWPEIDIYNTQQPIITNRSLFIYTDGNVEYTIGVSADFQTDLDFRQFPFDVQELPIKVDSFVWDKNILVFVPNSKVDAMHSPTAENLEYTTLQITETSQLMPWAEMSNNYQPSEYSTYIATIFLKRKIGFYLTEFFVPIFVILAMYFFSTLIFRQDFSDKVMISFTTFLVLVAGKFVINQSLPQIAYLTVVDKIFLFSYFVIAVSLIIDCLEMRWQKKEWMPKFNFYSRVTIIFSYILVVSYIFLTAK